MQLFLHFFNKNNSANGLWLVWKDFINLVSMEHLVI